MICALREVGGEGVQAAGGGISGACNPDLRNAGRLPKGSDNTPTLKNKQELGGKTCTECVACKEGCKC